MSKMKYWASLLAIAAVLASGFSACTKTDPDTPSAKPQKIHVSLKADVNNLQTHSSVEYANGVRTLKITAGGSSASFITISTSSPGPETGYKAV